MNSIVVKSLIASVPACMFLAGATAKFASQKNWVVLLQLLGAAGLLVVVLSHICEGTQLLAWMGWGREHSIGHYVDLSGSLLFAFFPVGYLLEALTAHPQR
jgi:hypothetical protein